MKSLLEWFFFGKSSTHMNTVLSNSMLMRASRWPQLSLECNFSAKKCTFAALKYPHIYSKIGLIIPNSHNGQCSNPHNFTKKIE